MGFFKYLRKVLENKADVYRYENQVIREAGSTLFVFLICMVLLVFQPFRVFLKWIAYFSIGFCAIFMLCLFCGSWREIRKSFRYAKRLEKLGTSVEEEEMARRNLCEREGDDGFSSTEK